MNKKSPFNVVMTFFGFKNKAPDIQVNITCNDFKQTVDVMRQWNNPCVRDAQIDWMNRQYTK